jgi:hypothetical protein
LICGELDELAPRSGRFRAAYHRMEVLSERE